MRFALSKETATKTAILHVNRLPRKQHALLMHVFKNQTKNSAPEIHMSLNWSKSGISRLGSALAMKGYLNKIPSIPVFYELTSKGKKYCCTFAVQGSISDLVHRLHGPLCFISPIRFKGGIGMTQELKVRLEDDNFVSFYPASGTWYKKRIFQVLVLFTPSTVQFYMPEFYGNHQEVYNDAMELLWQTIAYLEQEYSGLKIGTPKEVARIKRQELAKLNDPLSIEYKKTGEAMGKKIIYISDRMKIDTSKGIPELETHHKLHAKDDMTKITEMYEDVIRSDFDIKDFKKDLNNIKLMVQGGLNTTMALEQAINVLRGDLSRVAADNNKIANIQPVLAATIKTMTREISQIKKKLSRRQSQIFEYR